MLGTGRALSVALAALVLAAGLVATAFAASLDFAEPGSSPEPVGGGPQGIVAADLDGDGDPDLAVPTNGTGLTILKNRGDARFREPDSSPYPVGSFPADIAAADIDGDFDRDLLVVNQVSEDITVFKNKGSGNFKVPASSPEAVGDSPASVATADLDGDGDEDAVVANTGFNPGEAPNVTILKNRGNGNFSEPNSSPESAGTKPVDAVPVKLDGDADFDLAVADQQSHAVVVLLNGGGGNFQPAPTSPESAGTFAQAIAPADLDGDGDRDLAVANNAIPGTATILLNDGDADLDAPAFPAGTEPTGDNALAIAAADFNQAGGRDLAVPSSADSNVTILRNIGDGDFSEPASSPEATGAQPQDIAVADYDGDGDRDIAVPNANGASVTILLNQ